MAETTESSKGQDIVSKTEISATTNDGIPIKTLYVWNLPENVTKQDLEKIFSIYGGVKCNTIKKTSRLFTFITFTDENIAVKVRMAANQQKIVCGNKILCVSPAYSNRQPDSVVYQEKMKRTKTRYTKKGRTSQRLKVEKSKNSTPSIMLNLLDDDSFIKIFSYLSMRNRLCIERVCKRWQAINLQCWSDIKELRLGADNLDWEMCFRHRLINDRAIEKIFIRCGRFLKTLDINSFKLNVTSHIISMIAEHCRNLTCLTLQLDKYPNMTMAKLIRNTKKLSSLKLIDLDKKFSSDCLKNLPIDSIKEISLIAKFNGAIGPESLKKLSSKTAENLPKMVKLFKLELNGFVLKPQNMEWISNNKTITHLILANCSLPESVKYITKMSGLEYLSLYQVVEVDDNFLVKLVASCTDLQYLDIGYTRSVSNVGINAIANLKSLEILKIDHLYNVSDAAISQFKNLKILHCTDCYSICDNGVIQVLKNSPLLEELNLYGTGVSTSVLDVAHDITLNRSNAQPLRIIVDSVLKFEWDRPPDSSHALLIVDVLNDDNLWDLYSNDDDQSSDKYSSDDWDTKYGEFDYCYASDF